MPAYGGLDIVGRTALFSGEQNGLSRWGMCVDRDSILPGAGLLEGPAANCPVPCNPTWDHDAISSVCGVGRSCCQTVELSSADCIYDDDTGCYRPIRGPDVADELPWPDDVESTLQDPTLSQCGEIAASGLTSYNDCIDQLGAADRRGFCMQLPPGYLCPTLEDTYVDACEAMNTAASGCNG